MDNKGGVMKGYLFGLRTWVQFINSYFNYTYGDARCVLCH